jgi:hypothetical protein
MAKQKTPERRHCQLGGSLLSRLVEERAINGSHDFAQELQRLLLFPLE